jgi:anti-sigma-K factor RskA
MQMDCEAVRDNIDAWALGALEAGEARALEAHVAGCAACAALAGAAREGAASLALAVPLVSASPALKARVMASAPAFAGIPARAPSRMPRWWLAATAAAILVGLGALGWGAYLQTRVNDLHNREARARVDATAQSGALATMRAGLAGNQDAVLEIVSQADVKRLPMSGTDAAPSAKGSYVWSRAGGLGALIATNLPPLPEGQSYCMWVVYQNAWVNGGLFTADETGTGRLIVRNLGDGQDRGAFRGFAVTVEPSTGTTKHTGATVLQSQLN